MEQLFKLSKLSFSRILLLIIFFIFIPVGFVLGLNLIMTDYGPYPPPFPLVLLGFLMSAFFLYLFVFQFRLYLHSLAVYETGIKLGGWRAYHPKIRGEYVVSLPKLKQDFGRLILWEEVKKSRNLRF